MGGGEPVDSPPPLPQYLDLLLQDLLVLLLLVEDVLLLGLLQRPLVHVAPVHLLELLTFLEEAKRGPCL